MTALLSSVKVCRMTHTDLTNVTTSYDGAEVFDPADWLTPAQAAGILGVTTQTLRNWSAAGTLIPRRDRPTGARRYHVRDVEFLAAARRSSAAAKAARQAAVDTPAIP